MRISDWSSDVCSSDLFLTADEKDCYKTSFEIDQRWLLELAADRTPYIDQAASLNLFIPADVEKRSEEHTSELQSLMRISYAVFCLKKKKKQNRQKQNRKPQHKPNTNTHKNNKTQKHN